MLEEELLEMLRLREQQASGCGYRYEFQVHINEEEKEVRLDLSCMYEMGDFVNFDFLSLISEKLGTKKIDLENEYYQPGCESCDYGSVSSVTIVAKDVTVL